MLTIDRAKEITTDVLRPFGLAAPVLSVRWAAMGGWRLDVIVSGYPVVSVETGVDWTEESVRWDLLTALHRTLNCN
jgi:hypothetical protein